LERGGRERHVRLFKKSHAKYGRTPVHEGIDVSGEIGHLSNPIEHFSYRDLDDYIGKFNTYTSLIAQKKFQEGKRFHFWHHLRLPYEFFVRYILKLGFLDGQAGLVYAGLSSFYVWVKFLKLKDLEG